MLIKKCKAPTFAHNSARWYGHLCSQWSREDQQSKYLTLPAASRCAFPGIYLPSYLPWGFHMACGDCGSLGGGEPQPRLCPSQRPSGPSLASPFHEVPTSRQGPEHVCLREMAGSWPFKWRLLVLCKLFCAFSLEVAHLWGSLLASSAYREAGSPRGLFPFRGTRGVNVGSHQQKPLDNMFILEIRNRCLWKLVFGL